MRRSSRVVLVVAVVAVAGLVSVSPAFAKKGPDLAVVSLAEPPDGVGHGGAWQQAYTVANQGNRRSRRTSTEFYLSTKQHNPRSGDSKLIGRAARKRIRRLAGGDQLARRIKLRVPTSVNDGLYYLVACIDRSRRVRETDEGNNCRITGQVVSVGSAVTGPDLVGGGGGGGTGEATIARFSLPIGSPTVQGVNASRPFGDDEKSNQRKKVAQVGPVSVIADCKRTTNGDSGDPSTAPTSPNQFEEDGDEAKLLVYTSSGTVTFNGPGASSRRNLPPGEGTSAPQDPGAGFTQANETTGGEGKHMAIAAARDPEQSAPERDWSFAYKVASIYVSHSSGTEFILTAYAGIDVLGVGDRCVFGGTVKVVHT